MNESQILCRRNEHGTCDTLGTNMEITTEPNMEITTEPEIQLTAVKIELI